MNHELLDNFSKAVIKAFSTVVVLAFMIPLYFETYFIYKQTKEKMITVSIDLTNLMKN